MVFMSDFELLQPSLNGKRRGILKTPHGDLATPFFMPIATRAAVKTLSSVDVEKLGSPIVLSNTYHLMLRPGMDIMKQMGGLHGVEGGDFDRLRGLSGFLPGGPTKSHGRRSRVFVSDRRQQASVDPGAIHGYSADSGERYRDVL